MSFGFRSVPADVELNPLSTRVFDVLTESTSFPWAVMFAQAKRIKVDPANLTPESLRTLTPLIAQAVGRFSSPLVEKDLAIALEALTNQPDQ